MDENKRGCATSPRTMSTLPPEGPTRGTTAPPPGLDFEPAGRTRSGNVLSAADVSRIIEMAWEDRTPFESIEVQFGLNESGVVALMRLHLKRSSFRMWRTRMAGRVTKHLALRSPQVQRHRASHTRQA